MKEITCIVCPNGCKLSVEKENGEYIIKGHKCKRGITFAIQEMEDPRRTLCTTVKTCFKEIPRLSVRTDGEIQKHLIEPLMQLLRKTEVKEPVTVGEIIEENVFDSGVNVIATTNLKQQLAYIQRS
jgi:CxxC motif-containing protein